MNNFSQLGAKLLPFALIAGLIVVFQLLGVFSLQPSAVEPTRAVANAPAGNGRDAKPVAGQKATAGSAPNTVPLQNNRNVTGNANPAPLSAAPHPPPQFVPEGIPTPQRPRETVAPVPQYVPPPQTGQTPLAGEAMNASGEPVVLPNHEISEEESQISEEQAQQIEGQVQAPSGEPQPSR